MSSNSNHWTQYWQSGVLTSLPQDFNGNYEGELKSKWYCLFSEIENKSTVLDVCTGNGAIAMLASEYANQNNKEFDIKAVDAAVISEPSFDKNRELQYQLFKKIEFIENTKIEELTLEANSIDLITSQYGIEYCDWKSSAEVISRILKPSGIFALICHGNETMIMKVMSKEEKEYKLLYDSGVFKLFSDFVQNQLNGIEFLSSLTKAFVKLGKQERARKSNIIASVASASRHLTEMSKNELEANKAKINDFYKEHYYAFCRLKDVVSVSRKIKASPHWYRIFEEFGLKLEEHSEILQNNQHNAGYYYKFRKQS